MLLGVLVSLQENWVKRHKILVVVIFAILGIAGLFASMVESSRAAKASAELSSKIGSLAESSKEQTRLSLLNTDLQQRLLKQSDTISKLSERNIGEASGGDSYCYVTFVGDTGDSAELIAIHVGKYPLRDIRVRLVDQDAFQERVRRQGLSVEAVLSAGANGYYIGDLAKKSASIFGRYGLSGRAGNFLITFSALNGTWQEVLRRRKVEEKWAYAIKVFRYRVVGKSPTVEQVLMQKVDPNFPRTKGKIDWSMTRAATPEKGLKKTLDSCRPFHRCATRREPALPGFAERCPVSSSRHRPRSPWRYLRIRRPILNTGDEIKKLLDKYDYSVIIIKSWPKGVEQSCGRAFAAISALYEKW